MIYLLQHKTSVRGGLELFMVIYEMLLEVVDNIPKTKYP